MIQRLGDTGKRLQTHRAFGTWPLGSRIASRRSYIIECASTGMSIACTHNGSEPHPKKRRQSERSDTAPSLTQQQRQRNQPGTASSIDRINRVTLGYRVPQEVPTRPEQAPPSRLPGCTPCASAPETSRTRHLCP